ncbi:hypothetical protein CSC27_7061 [Pseudomonas aeruginosa]|nr:hypothetical protein CSC27_7061 [Pseudomonas aeruginosa]
MHHFHRSELTAIAIAYRNGRMIADEVLPAVPVGKQDSSTGSTTSPGLHRAGNPGRP